MQINQIASASLRNECRAKKFPFKLGVIFAERPQSKKPFPLVCISWKRYRQVKRNC